jgi:DNA-binding response OmpR family regulator
MGKILIVEDELHIQRLIKLVLERHGHSVDVATSGEDGLKVLSETPNYDLVILDILMPKVDGLQVLAAIKKQEKTKHIPVVMLTALAQENVVLQGIKLGAKDYIRKPFHPSELIERISKIVA